MLGFGSSEIKSDEDKNGETDWYFDLLGETSTRINSLARESLLMLALAEAYGAKYDGWGTRIAIRDAR